MKPQASAPTNTSCRNRLANRVSANAQLVDRSTALDATRATEDCRRADSYVSPWRAPQVPRRTQCIRHLGVRTRLPGAPPLHHYEPGRTPISALPIRIARLWLRLIEKSERQPVGEQFSHVEGERAMPLLEANVRPFHPSRKLVEIAIDRIVQIVAIGVHDPTSGHDVMKLLRLAINRIPPGFRTRAISLNAARKSAMSMSVR
jgi:hypothetical protein